MGNKIKVALGAAAGVVASFAMVSYAFAADALSGMTSSSSPLDFANAGIADTKSYLYPVLGTIFVLGIVVAIIWLVYRKIHGVAKGKH